LAEGDTILRTARRLDAALTGKEVRASAPNPRGRAAGIEQLDGRRVERIESHGKHLLVRFDGGIVLHSHLGMNGSWQLYAPGARWRRSRGSAWAVLGTDDAQAVQFGGSTLRVLAGRRLSLDPILSRLGADILAEDFDSAKVAAALRRTAADREIGDALLDQRLVAGIGNIFKSEGTFAAEVNPWRRVADLTEHELDAVLERTRELMRGAVVSGRHPHRVYRRAGEPCRRCRTRLRSQGQGDANRSTYWCPRCQPGSETSR
jgi:endonuclease-8